MITINNEQELEAFFEGNEQAIITYYLEQECEGCEDLLPVYEELAEDPAYQNIKFGLMLAQPGSIAENLVKQKEVPFVAIYKAGEMIKCGSVNSEKDYLKMLRKF
jgi:thiol-disulfide isomerase/thioredoxin